jgi:hypothetical protein
VAYYGSSFWRVSMKVNIITTEGSKAIFNHAVKVECDGKNLYIYDGPFIIFQTIIPLNEIKEYGVSE